MPIEMALKTNPKHFPGKAMRFSKAVTFSAFRLLALASVLAALTAVVSLWDAGETGAAPVPPSWETLARHQATASYWLDDDPGPPPRFPQDEVDEQEHVY